MPTPHDITFKSRYPTLEQNDILNTSAPSVLIRALAGTGKTTTLVIKAADLIRTSGRQRILMLAYSDAGLRAIHQRLQQFAPDVAHVPQIMTVEQLCAALLHQQGDPLVRVTEPLQQHLLIQQAHAALLHSQQHREDPELIDFLARALDVPAFLAFAAQAKQQLLLRKIHDSGMSALAYCQEHGLDYGLHQLLLRYERLRVNISGEPQFYTPGDCTYEIAQQLCQLDFEEVFAPLMNRFDAVLFDELQDLDEAAMQVLRHVVRAGNGQFVGAGDFNQHILPGAFSVFGDGQRRILQALPAQTQVLTLSSTYRFGNAICQGLNPLFDVQFSAHYPKKSAQFHPLTYVSDEDCTQQLLHIYRSVLQRSTASAPQLHVVLRAPEDSIPLEWHFAHEGVHYACQGMQRLYQRRELALVLAIMSAMQGSGPNTALSKGILSSAIEGLLRYVHTVRTPDYDMLANGSFDMEALGDASVEFDTKAVADQLMNQPSKLRHFLIHATTRRDAPVAAPLIEKLLNLPPEICADAGQLCQHPLLEKFFAQAPISPAEQRSCADGLRALSRIAAGLPVPEFLGRLTLMVRNSIAQHQHKEIPTLTLLTVERCKGHEYENVVVPFVERGRFPGSATPQEAYRERNMLYVAMTRARQCLWLLESARRPISPGPV